MVDLIHVAATPAISIGSVGAAHGEGRPLVLAELVWDRRSRVRSRVTYFIQVQFGTYWYVLVCPCTYCNVLTSGA